LFETPLEGLTRHVDEMLYVRGHLFDGEGDGGVREESIELNAAVDAYDVSGGEPSTLGRNPVHHLEVYAGAQRGRKAVEPLEGRLRPIMVPDEAFGETVELLGGDSRRHAARYFPIERRKDRAGTA